MTTPQRAAESIILAKHIGQLFEEGHGFPRVERAVEREPNPHQIRFVFLCALVAVHAEMRDRQPRDGARRGPHDCALLPAKTPKQRARAGANERRRQLRLTSLTHALHVVVFEDMTDFMAQNRGQLSLVLGKGNEAAGHEDAAVWKRERVRTRIVHHSKGEQQAWPGLAWNDALAKFVDVFLEKTVVIGHVYGVAREFIDLVLSLTQHFCVLAFLLLIAANRISGLLFPLFRLLR
jgi:hypothetical protein